MSEKDVSIDELEKSLIEATNWLMENAPSKEYKLVPIEKYNKMVDALKSIRRWSEAFDPDICEPITDETLEEYELVLNRNGLSATRLKGEMIRRIMADIVPIIDEALGEDHDRER